MLEESESCANSCRDTATQEFVVTFLRELQSFARLCGSVLDHAQQENLALAGRAKYQPADFDQKRRTFLQPLETALSGLRRHRELWSQLKSQARAGSAELSALLGDIQNLLMRILQLDRENQQAMLRRGLVPVQHVPPAAKHQPHFVADIYRRHIQKPELTRENRIETGRDSNQTNPQSSNQPVGDHYGR